jgi:hypothetical protein
MSATAVATAQPTTPSFRVTLFAIAAGIALLAALIAVPFANAQHPSNVGASTVATSLQ